MSEIFEFSRPVDVHRLGHAGTAQDIAASEDERKALARRFDLLALDRLAAKVKLAPLAHGFWRLAAAFEAELAQACVVTLEPVPSRIAESFSLIYGAVDDESVTVLDASAEVIEPIGDGVIDIGEAVAQQLSLALDPFPRAPEAAAAAESAALPGLASPFAVLRELRTGKKK
jgi:uncharacterized metal-binding protein YceD (DUF177 family)